MSENWEKFLCDKCSAVNWLYLGDMSDETYPDVEGFICRMCKRSHSFSDDIELEMGIGDDPERFEIGLDKPEGV